jgi:hypothetical protein
LQFHQGFGLKLWLSGLLDFLVFQDLDRWFAGSGCGSSNQDLDFVLVLRIWIQFGFWILDSTVFQDYGLAVFLLDF